MEVRRAARAALRLGLAITVLHFGTLPLAAQATVAYYLVDLGSVEPAALNATARVVGAVSPSNHVQLDSRPVVWESGMMRETGLLEGSTWGAAAGVNAAGQVVGWSAGGFWDRHAFLWDGEEMTDLGSFGGTRTQATAINDLGEVVGFSDYSVGFSSGSRAFVWRSGTMTPLTPLTWGGDTVARAINNLGEIAGDATSGVQTGFLWRNGATTPIDTLGGSHTWVHGINDLSQVVGASDVPGNAEHAFLWDNGAMSDLGTLPGGIFSGANDINNAQVIVGSSETDQCDPTVTSTCRRISHAVLWRDGVMADLNDLIVPSPGWVLNSALAINENGEIVGYGTVAGARRYFLVRPLPPSGDTPRPRPVRRGPRRPMAASSAQPQRVAQPIAPRQGVESARGAALPAPGKRRRP